VLQVTCVSSSGIPCGFTLDVFIKKTDSEVVERSEGSEVMLGWIVMLMGINEMLLFVRLWF
jgi:hypothetical protein